MLRYPDQPTPPFNSPYQQQSESSSMLESPYPSPNRHDGQQKYTEGLGLYDYHTSLPRGLPPSPQPSENWNPQMSTGVSPLMTDTIADPWTSGAFDHPVTRSPLPWASAHNSPRSSLSSCTREMSAFSHDGSEQAFPGVKVEYPGWAQEMRWGAAEPADMRGLSSSRNPSLTVAPERLNSDVFSYEHTYGVHPVPKLESTPMYDYNNRTFERETSEDSTVRDQSRSNYSSINVPTERARNRRHTDPANAPYRCPSCPDKGFKRRYNLNQHMLLHEPNRRKENPCPVEGCSQEFRRKTDLARHDQSVHQKVRPYKCSRCSRSFPRKDTLRRHEDDGCTRRNQVPVTDSRVLTQLRHDGYAPATGL
ncbi:hypothetical protein HBI56_171570 [Parastagonospora nodorum]|uniref:C2H2-type domain-containing protein n=2 Tax=Phaeosphaeria nodorum (strain SN15 / ATCC MYA-4574 / FGSC 10173) TaxID=321614 RepID=A0A7U2F1U9_PHANO|nr:hypothetical protein SNOG_14031 [Parastagonospora nodorum SN15]KAH3904486.1 hypothetical protein HBH56_234380 [Parastagonospora nodorum]EAT78656.1 hypothetical protein SNOG_14031 [Parastagonospora nodorum SN15]KAH3921307.1 hypothetical protein HBH54_242440 [Parastagonospora nodorum]KAH3944648.1 hypothetical protein HBH53_157810 [Parastagonospora nodorum]KAH3959330.1 hypothetical protein HBH52_244610 [Parastagonospora nodorum]